MAPDEALLSIVLAFTSLEADGGPPLIVLEHEADPSALDERLTDLATREADRFGAPCWSSSALWLCRPDATTIVVGPLEPVTRTTALAWHAAERPDTDGPLWPASSRVSARLEAEAEAAAEAEAEAAAEDGDDESDGADETASDEADGANEATATPPAPTFTPEPAESALDDDDAEDRADEWLDTSMPDTFAETIEGLERGSGIWMVVVPGDAPPEPWIGHIETITTTVRLSDALRIRMRIRFDDPDRATAQRDLVDAGLTSLATRPELRAVGLADAIAGFTATSEGPVLDVRVDVPSDDVDALVEQGAAILSSELE